MFQRWFQFTCTKLMEQAKKAKWHYSGWVAIHECSLIPCLNINWCDSGKTLYNLLRIICISTGINIQYNRWLFDYKLSEQYRKNKTMWQWTMCVSFYVNRKVVGGLEVGLLWSVILSTKASSNLQTAIPWFLLRSMCCPSMQCFFDKPLWLSEEALPITPPFSCLT